MAPTPVPPLNRLIDGASTFEGRIIVTIVLFGLLAGAGWLARAIRIRLDSEQYTRVVNAVIAVGLLIVATVIGTALVSLWGVSVLDFFNIGNPIEFAAQAVTTIVLLLGTYVFTGVFKRLISEFTEDRTAITRHQTELIFRSTQVSLYILAGIIVLGVWRVNLSGLLVGAGFLGIVVGLAARQTLGSLIAGFVLMFARPFEIGDWVQIGDKEGIVTDITIVNTRIETFDGEYVMLPNDTVSSTEIVNRTRKGRLRLHVEVGVDYATDIDRAAATARDATRAIDEILTVPQPQVVLKEFSNSSIVLDVRFWIDKPTARKRWRAQTAVINAVKDAFEQEGIKIPFPQRELSGRAETGGFRIAEPQSVDVPPDPTPDGGDG